MNVSTRLILLLLLTVVAVVVIATWITSREQAAILEKAARDEVRAHALTLQIVLEEDYATGRTLDAQRLINRLRENTQIYGVFLFDANGTVTISSNPSAPEEIRYAREAQQVMVTGETIEVSRNIDGQDLYSLIVPIRKEGVRIGAFEIAQPISFVNSYVIHARRDISLTAALLGLAVFFVVLIVTHFSLRRPVQNLLAGANAVGKGDLAYRVEVPRGGGEFTILASEFNRMADSLVAQRQRAAREAEERLALERRLRHSERLASVGRLAAGIAHEMGAPLQVIDGRAKQLLNQSDHALETRQRNLNIIRAQTDRITHTVRQLLNLAHPYNLRLQPMNLEQLISDALELIEPDASRAGITIDFVAVEPLMVKVDPGLINQVLLNIFRNALQAMSALENPSDNATPGSLTIRYQRIEKDTRLLAQLSIADTGGGIDQEYLPQVFDPFFTTKEIGQGTGLGLAVSNRIMQEHQGWIEVGNNEQGGATFCLYLPLDQNQENYECPIVDCRR